MSKPLWVGWVFRQPVWEPIVHGDTFPSTLEQLQKTTRLRSDGLMVLRYGTHPTLDIPDRVVQRHTKPKPPVTANQGAMLKLMLVGPITLRDVRIKLLLSPQLAANRMRRLQAAGLVELAGRDKVKGYPWPHNIWVITDLGRKALEVAEEVLA